MTGQLSSVYRDWQSRVLGTPTLTQTATSYTTEPLACTRHQPHIETITVLVFAVPSGHFYHDVTTETHLSGLSHLEKYPMMRIIQPSIWTGKNQTRNSFFNRYLDYNNKVRIFVLN